MTTKLVQKSTTGYRQKRILLAMGWYDHRVHCGIAKYAAEQGWHLYADSTKENVIPWGWDGDGILAWLGAGDDLAEFVVQAKKPTVDFSFRRPHLPFPRVLEDPVAIARLAGEHFLARGMSHFLVYTARANWRFEENGDAFCKFAAQAGYPCKWLHWHKSSKFTENRRSWRIRHDWLGEELRKAPKPVAVFATTDDHALEVLEACEDAGLAVPDEVSIIGVDNSLLAVEAMQTPISSVDANSELIGYRAAALLNDLMQGKPAPPEPLRVPPAGLICRKSSDLIAVAHHGLGKCLRFLLDHYHEPIGVDDMARAAAMSRRALHQAFIDHLHRTPARELHRTRIERAKAMLAQRAHKIEVLAAMCGYQSGNSFFVAFKHATGMSPKAYRASIETCSVGNKHSGSTR